MVPTLGDEDGSGTLWAEDERAARAAPVLRLVTQSGQPFKLQGAPPAEWRARCHDFLGRLTPVATLRRELEQTTRLLARGGVGLGLGLDLFGLGIGIGFELG